MFRVVGVSFDHMHMGDLLRQVREHPEAEIAGIFDPGERKPSGNRFIDRALNHRAARLRELL
jgi:hypothetical protein